MYVCIRSAYFDASLHLSVYVFDLYQPRSHRGFLGVGWERSVTIGKKKIFFVAVYVTVYTRFAAASKLETAMTASHPRQEFDHKPGLASSLAPFHDVIGHVQGSICSKRLEADKTQNVERSKERERWRCEHPASNGTRDTHHCCSPDSTESNVWSRRNKLKTTITCGS